MGDIRLTTPIPGPRSQKVLAQKDRFVPRAVSVHAGCAIESGRGALVTDLDGNTFIDLAGGLGVLNVGQSPPEVVSAVADQAARFMHTDFSVVCYESYVELARRLAGMVPGDGPLKAAFFNSGAEAVENAVKIARAYTGRPAIITFEGAFHGRTLLAMSLTSKVKPYKQGFGPFAPEVYRVPYPYCYRCSRNGDARDCGEDCIDELAWAFRTRVDPESVAAVIIEPIQGESGFIVPPEGFVERLVELLRSHGILLIADEVQTGFGRTGRMFAADYWSVAPDLVTVAKSLAAGMPLSGVVGRAEVMDAPEDSTIGGTYVGNPLACVAALKVLDIMEREGLADRALQLGERLRDRLEAMAERFPLIGDIRGRGAMMAVELVRDRETKEPAPGETTAIIKAALQRGVICVGAGIYGNVIRFLMPLVITDDQLDEALGVLEDSFAVVEQAQPQLIR